MAKTRISLPHPGPQAIAFAYPFTAQALSDFARTYDFEATMHDTDASIRRRLSH